MKRGREGEGEGSGREWKEKVKRKEKGEEGEAEREERYLLSWLALIDSAFSTLYSPTNCLCQFSRIQPNMRSLFCQLRAFHNIRKLHQFRTFRQVHIVRTQFRKIWIAHHQMTELRVLDGIMTITTLFIHATHARSWCLHIYCIFIYLMK